MQDICWRMPTNTCGKEGWRRKQDWIEKLSCSAVPRSSPLPLKEASELRGSSELSKLDQGDRLLYPGVERSLYATGRRYEQVG